MRCPLCLGPTEMTKDGCTCEEGHSLDEEQAVRAFQDRVDRALWAAIRALEDHAAFGKYRERLGQPIPADTRHAEEHAEVLRDLMRASRERR